MTRGSKRCPVTGEPCRIVLDDLRAELLRLHGRIDQKCLPGVCPSCEEPNPIAIAAGPDCYGCRVRASEGDHVAGHGTGPAVWDGPANLNRISEEGERIWGAVGRGDLCRPCVAGFNLRLGLRLGRLGMDKE